MLYELGLLLSAIVHGWIAGDLVAVREWRRRFWGIALAAASVSLWAAGELLLGLAEGPGEVIAARRVLFLGVCALGPAWVWGAAQASGAGWVRRHPGLLGLLLAPELFAYAALWVEPRGWFIDWTAQPAQRGILFYVHALYSWSLVVAGFGILGRFLWRRSSRLRVAAVLGIAGGGPLGANLAYVSIGFAADPTPLVLGAVAVWLRFALLESLAPHYLLLARREVVDQFSAGLLVADPSGVVVDANPAASELLAIEDPLGRTLDDVVSQARCHPFRVFDVEETAITRGSTQLGRAVLIEDRTELAAAARHLEVATRFEALGFLIAGVAHEINNPLAYVRGNLGLLKTLVEGVEAADLAAALPAPARRVARDGGSIVGDAIEGADRIAALVRRLGTFTQQRQPGGAEDVEVALVVRRAIDMAVLGRAPDLVVITREDELPVVAGRSEDLVQVVLHLLINAIQAGAKTAPVEVELRDESGQVEVRVLDRGPGIPEHLLPHVFDPFFTTKAGDGNMGLGLSLSYDLARQNGGRLEASQRIGGGAVFTLRLPSSDALEG